ncbi:MAG: hypothetical protein L0212_04175 [Acidobacteria bacterium]|nr:hypothetical protein [Acidobacteriota bacterium]
MRPRPLLVLVLLLAACARPAPAQFLGFVSPQTTQQQAFNAVGSGLRTFNVRNIGQNAHIVFYACTDCTTVQVSIQGSFDASTWFDISDNARNTAQGAVLAEGYYPVVRVRADVTGGAASFSAWYSGTSISLPRQQGVFNSSWLGLTTIFSSADASVTQLGSLDPEGTQLSGTLYIFSPIVGTAGAGCRIEMRLAATDVFVPEGKLVFPISSAAPLNSGFGLYLVPEIDTTRALVTYTCATFPGAGSTLTALFVRGGTVNPQGRYFSFPVQTSAGITAGLAATNPTRLSTSSGQVAMFSLTNVAKDHTVHLAVTGSPTTCTQQLEGSLDSTDGSNGTWFSISGAVDCAIANNRMYFVLDRPVIWVRSNLIALAGGASPTVQMIYMGVN